MDKIKAWADDIILHFWHCASTCRPTASTSDDEAVEIMKVCTCSISYLNVYTYFNYGAPMDHASFLSEATLIEIGVYINILPIHTN